MKLIACLTIVMSTAGAAWCQDAGWPRTANDGGTKIVVYQPQPDSLDGTTLHSRVAVSIKRPVDKAPVFGALSLLATLDVDRTRDSARIVSVTIERSRFTGVADADVQSAVRFLESDRSLWDTSISLTGLKATLLSDQGGPNGGYRNDPPRIIVVNSPAFLLLLDGEPRLKDAGSGVLQKVVNTAFPIVFDQKTNQYWLYGSSVWFTTTDLLRGKWLPADTAPSNITELVRDPDTLASVQEDAGKAAAWEQLRTARVIVATEPTELIVTQGAPQYSPVGAGDLLYVTNTDSDIFLETATQRHFIVISGRWFEAASLEGPWNFVAPEKVPVAFASIPETSPKAGALAFVPGTNAAKDALMDSVIPQTAEISRNAASIQVQYDGAPQFAPIPDTQLAYALNTPSQIIRAGGMYYACEEGVWYAASRPDGPWRVSDTRPAGIDGVPPSSPVYNTKFVYIYDSSPSAVYVGYLPGYRWSFPYHGVVYYGTGWRYGGWFGQYYYPRPATWGFFVRYDPWTGWHYGTSWTAGWLGLTSHWGSAWAGWTPLYGPGLGFWSGYHAGGWFGPGGYRPPRPHSRPPSRPGRGRPTILPYPGPGRPGNNLYTRPGKPGVGPRPGRPGSSPAPFPPRPQSPRPGAVAGSGRGARGGKPTETRPAPVIKPNQSPGVPRNGRAGGQPRRDGSGRPDAAPSRPTPGSQAPRNPRPPRQPPTPDPRPSVPTEPRGRGPVEGDRGAKNRGPASAPRNQEPDRRRP